ncbi:Uncharacterised protein [Enterobacter cloacae]|nr:Uncharacterised protein [Enterobacter asburiae]CZW15346.1 Uncharacterised protein [Enterobacter cloacae]SAD00018.1 Uncharacterised protein [Enterobacter cloacae]SAE87406.1 Uncharacterised protein [Enterobacter asburiae]SAF62509.1 Uncharacterised protein [Enterobacter asburiae]
MVKGVIQRLFCERVPMGQRRLSLNGMTQIHQHDHPKFCCHPGQSDKTGAGCHRHMEALPVKEPNSPDQGERQTHQDQQRFIHATERQIQQNKDDHHRHRHHQLQFLVGVFEQLKLPGE